MQVYANNNSTKIIAHIKLTLDNQPIIIELFDNSASRQLLKQLPLSLTLSDFAGEEKIAYLPNKLILQDTPKASTIPSDFTYYAPWGNLAIFYKGYGQAEGVYALGRIKDGKELLAQLKQNTTVTLEYID
ncbi:cyclophilin-like fold protein [Gilliamella sp. wkB108]|uniref:cyclophilin-like fold protein n=1 Tax=Gilliamella sp. wkB108 TaxID=3120256 RepID=UPI0009BF09EA|nr:cyclophilin-like fold protein [Gilliamella apicola]